MSAGAPNGGAGVVPRLGAGVSRATIGANGTSPGAGLRPARTLPPVDFGLPAELVDLRDRVAAFVREELIPREPEAAGPHGPSEELRGDLQARARAAGVFAPHVAREWGGQDLSHVGRAVVFEEAGYSLLGPLALNIAAPDEGNMHLLAAVATRAQQVRWLGPLAAGEIRSCFAMTEPHPGAGSDPSMLQTVVRAVDDGFVVSGRKWLITGAEGASVCIVLGRDAVTGERDGVREGGATMLLVPMDAPGLRIERVLETLDTAFSGGHAELVFDDVFAPADAVLGQPGEAFRHAQLRLGPARLTHCMRWLGAARRAHDVATTYAREREAFGRRLGDHEGVGFALADNQIELHSCRLAILHAAWTLDQGGDIRVLSAMCKAQCAEAYWRVVDRSLQILGGLGITGDTVVAQIFRDLRPFRIYDGPTEVHKWYLARRILGRPGGRGDGV